MPVIQYSCVDYMILVSLKQQVAMPFRKNNRQSIRLKGYNYAQAGLYFITICTHNREHLFGSVMNGAAVLNNAGRITAKCRQDIPVHFSNAVLHDYIVMPNHVHGIIELQSLSSAGGQNVGVQNFDPLHFDPSQVITENKFQQIIPQSIGSIIRGFKIGVTKWFRYENGYQQDQKIWQRNYYDHIIRNNAAYHRITQYIINNPLNWKDDRFFTSSAENIP